METNNPQQHNSRQRIDKDASKTARAVKFIAYVTGRRGLISMDVFKDEETWGHARTVKRMISDINKSWEQGFGHPFVETITSENNAIKSIRLVSSEISSSDEEILVVLTTYLSLVPELRGSWFEKVIKELIKNKNISIPAGAKTKMDRILKIINRVAPSPSPCSSGMKGDMIGMLIKAANEVSETTLKLAGGSKGRTVTGVIQSVSIEYKGAFVVMTNADNLNKVERYQVKDILGVISVKKS